MLKLFIQGYEYHYNNRPDKFKNRTNEDLKEILFETMEKSNVLIIEKDKIIISYAAFQIKENVFKILWIDELVVDEKFRNEGYGSLLMNKLKDIAKEENCKKVEFCCWEFNNNAKVIYEHLGYKKQRVIYESDVC